VVLHVHPGGDEISTMGAGAGRLSADEFRALALDLEGAIEGAHMGHPDFRANGRIFASLDKAERRGTVKLTPGEQRELMRAHAAVFAPAAGAWGRQGWTTVQLERAGRTEVRAALLLAWQGVLEQPGPRRPRGSRGTAGSSGTSRKKP
jgi:hypothetical protein